MASFLWVCLGGAFGSGARYLLSVWMQQVLGTAFPYGTLAVNLIGSFLLAMLLGAGSGSSALSPTLRLLLATGVLGGFTTYSSFSFETLRLFQQGAWPLAGLNVLATVLGCLAACLLGWSAARWMFAG